MNRVYNWLCANERLPDPENEENEEEQAMLKDLNDIMVQRLHKVYLFELTTQSVKTLFVDGGGVVLPQS